VPAAVDAFTLPTALWIDVLSRSKITKITKKNSIHSGYILFFVSVGVRGSSYCFS
jgi:hypothetical protein